MNRETIAALRPLERRALLEELGAMVAEGELSLGQAARILRSAILGMDRGSFAKAVRVSARAIANLEDDPGANPRLQTLTRVFAPMGATLGLVFPRMVERPPLGEDSLRRREALAAALRRSRRQRRLER